ncbi:unnamed protein product [Ixodes pacificus]
MPDGGGRLPSSTSPEPAPAPVTQLSRIAEISSFFFML